MILRPLAVIALLALAGCATVPTSRQGGWTLQASATAGAALVWADVAGREPLRIACRRNPADLYVASDIARPAAGPVTLHVDEASFTLTPARDEPRLAATAPMPDALPAALMSAKAVRLTHGAGRTGPFPAPNAKIAAAFAIACRGPTSRRAGAWPG
jgi:hypothetical protein